MEDFVNFSIAKKLKEKGYPQRTFGEYDMQGACYIEDGRFYENGCITEVARAYTAPTISQVLKWLREQEISVEPLSTPYNDWKCYIKNKGEIVTMISGDKYDTYEQAAIAGIEYVLDNLI